MTLLSSEMMDYHDWSIVAQHDPSAVVALLCACVQGSCQAQLINKSETKIHNSNLNINVLI